MPLPLLKKKGGKSYLKQLLMVVFLLLFFYNVLLLPTPTPTPMLTVPPPPNCMLRSFHHLCFSFDVQAEEQSSSCHQDPEQFIERQYQRYSPSQKQLDTRMLMHDKQIRTLSVGANKHKICDDVVVGSTMCTERAQLDLFEINSWISLALATRNKEAAGNSDSNSNGNSNGDSNNNSNSNNNAVNGFDVIFSEHVLEHFEPTQVERIAAASFAVLKPGGRFRIAVPDGYKPSPSYQHYIRPGGTPSGRGQSHMVAWTIENLAPLFANAGFEIVRKEHFESNGKFVSVEGAYDDEHRYGRVGRSFRHDVRNQKKPHEDFKNSLGNLYAADLKKGEPMYTSLWFDAVKPASCDYVLSV